jgi:diguanylate cyclase (GGDEF)-like protein
VVLLPGVAMEGARTWAEATRRDVESQRVTAPGGRMLPVTISMGGASCVPSQTTQDAELFQLADSALYEAKRAGRNRVEWAEAAPG